MNSSSSKPQQPSEEESLSNGPNEQESVRQLWTMESESAIDNLPDEVLLMIFRLLSTDELLIAEQVCLRWKSIVSTCFAATRQLELHGFELDDVLKKMKRYGPSLQSLKLDCELVREGNINWINEIGDAFPNLLSLSLLEMHICMGGNLSVLPVKCCQLTMLSLNQCVVADEDVGIILKGFPELKYLKLAFLGYNFGECFRELGTNIEHLFLSGIAVSETGTSHIFSRCKTIQTLEIENGFECNSQNFSMFCEKSPLRQLKLDGLEFSKEVYLTVSRLCLLEKLTLIGTEVDSDMLIKISRGCPNLKYVHLDGLMNVCDRGVKAFAKCQRLTHLQLIYLDAVTDESLFELAKAGILESLTINVDSISDRGVSAILAQCPNLKYLDVWDCSGVGDNTVDAAIQTVERRNATLDQSPHGASNSIVPSFKAVNKNGYLLQLCMSGRGLNRYKDGLSHSLLDLDFD